MKNRLKDYGNQVFTEYIGYRPNSSSVKPVHIANGLFRLITGESYSVDALNEWIIRWKQGKEIRTASDIREKYNEAFDETGFDDDEINKLRHFLNIVFNADNAAYPSANNTVLTISSKTQVRSSVSLESNINYFLYNLLTANIDGETSACIDLIKDCLNDENDDLSRVSSPLTNFARKNSVDIKNNAFISDDVERRLRSSFDLLAINERRSGNKLLSLERIIIFSCFAVINHLSSKILDISNSYNKHDRVPTLFCADDSLGSVKYASEETLLITKLTIEEFFDKGLEEVLKKEGYDRFSHEEILDRINHLKMEDSSKRTTNRQGEDEKRKSYRALYLGFYEQDRDSYKAFIKATRFKLFADEYTTDPTRFVISLGGRMALLAPRAQGGGRKRYSPDPLILEVLLYTILRSEQRLTLSDFGKVLWERYGIIIGANPEEDYENLTKWKVSQITPGDLAGELSINAEKIADVLISMGYGKRYADGVTVIYLRR